MTYLIAPRILECFNCPFYLLDKFKVLPFKLSTVLVFARYDFLEFLATAVQPDLGSSTLINFPSLY